MTIKSHYAPAARVVSAFARKYEVRSSWLWDVLDDVFNMQKGIGCLMTQDEIDDFEAVITDYMNE